MCTTTVLSPPNVLTNQNVIDKVTHCSVPISHISHRYTESGDCQGTVSDELFMPIRLSWNIPAACQEVIQTSLRQAKAIADDVDLHLEVR